MFLRKFSISLLVAAILGGPTDAGAISYSESLNGDLSGNWLAPTTLALDPGSNTVAGSMVGGDLEYLTVNLPAALNEVILRVYSSSQTLSFIAVLPGTTFIAPTNNPALLLGWTHFGPGPNGVPVGTNMLDNMGAGAGAQGFTGPLTGPVYTFWIQETGGLGVSYDLDFVVAPEPGTLWLAALGIGALAARRALS